MSRLTNWNGHTLHFTHFGSPTHICGWFFDHLHTYTLVGMYISKKYYSWVYIHQLPYIHTLSGKAQDRDRDRVLVEIEFCHSCAFLGAVSSLYKYNLFADRWCYKQCKLQYNIGMMIISQNWVFMYDVYVWHVSCPHAEWITFPIWEKSIVWSYAIIHTRLLFHFAGSVCHFCHINNDRTVVTCSIFLLLFWSISNKCTHTNTHTHSQTQRHVLSDDCIHLINW